MIRIAVVNAAWQLGHNSTLIKQACNGADVVLVCEALTLGGKAPEHLAKILPDGWRTNQNTTTTAMAGSAVCWRTAVMGHVGALHDPIEASQGNRLVRPRYLTPALLTYKPTGDVRRYVPFHAPLRITGHQSEFYDALTRYLARHPHAVAGGDGNRPHQWVTGRVGRAAVGSEVISLLPPQGHPAQLVRFEHSPYSDHPIVRAQIKPTRRVYG